MADQKNKVTALPGCKTPTNEPNQALVNMLKEVLTMAESGQLQCLIGTGFVASGDRFSLWADTHKDIYQMHGALGWLTAEYIHKHAEALS